MAQRKKYKAIRTNNKGTWPFYSMTQQVMLENSMAYREKAGLVATLQLVAGDLKVTDQE